MSNDMEQVSPSGRWSHRPPGGQSSEHAEEGSRAQAVFIRREDEVGAMAWNQRYKARFKNFFSLGKNKHEAQAAGDEEAQEAGSTGKPVQYRLEATRRAPKQSLFRRIITCGGFCGGSHRSSGLTAGINPNQKLAMYLHWMFRVNFVVLFAVMCVMFFALVILFAGFITAAGTVDPQCVRIGGNDFNSAGTAFADAFALSWTTFSTVGYGSTYPALAYENSNWANCFFINFVCSLESLLGVLYSGFCGAILFGKVLRIQSQAQVIFSDPIVVRYGSGIKDHSGEAFEDERKNPCPVLEFRVVNRLYNEIGGEIMDATLNVVANIDADDTDPSVRTFVEGDSQRGQGDNSAASDSASDSGSIGESARSNVSQLTSLHRFLDPVLLFSSRRDHQTVDEDPSARLVTKHIFSKMLIEASDHPFFKRVWLARHILDEHSPLLKARVRRQIRRNGGAWPERLNNYTAVRDSLRFNQILVSLNGVSNVSASDVYAQKIYDFVDVNVGYEFVNLLYRDSEGSLGVDTDLINDVREQNGPDPGEPLIFD